jgi:hypothetical protein
MKTIGYMEGTNSELLTNLLVDGVDTLPLSNGWDNHGKFIAHITRTDNISVVVGYLHKFFAISKEPKIEDEILSSLRAYKIPTVFIVPKTKQEKAKKLLKGKGVKFTLADPGDLTQMVIAALKPGKAKKAVKKTAKKKARKKVKKTVKRRR